jgi:DNA-directed RNA polymerase subunit beta'
VTDPGDTPLSKRQVLADREFREAVEKYGKNAFKAKMGAEGVKILLAEIDTTKLAAELREDFRTSSGQKKVRIVKRLEVVEAFKKSGNRPEWMILDVLPVLPPELRPMVQLDGGRFATSDLNDLYRRVINRNNRLNKLLQLGAPEIIVRNEKRMLQEAVDALIDNGRRGRPVTGAGNRALKSLSDMLKGKQGRFRQNLLGKRVDYSGRSVIVVGPELKLHQCGLPKEMALELFKPFVMKRVVADGIAHNIKTAKKHVDRARNEVWDILDQVIKEHPVLLNRAPTLHRLGIQAFEPVLVEGRAIKLHPLVCTAYNADFDGDQMAVHVPLSAEAQSEARFLMLSANNLLKPQDGKPVTVPTQDMVLGIYYMTIDKEPVKREPGDETPEPREFNAYTSLDEALMAHEQGGLGLHDVIHVRETKLVDGKPLTGMVTSTLGRFLFNEAIPQDIGLVDRSIPENALKLEADFLVGKKDLARIIDRCIKKHGTAITAEILDRIKSLGFHYSTTAGISIGIFDMIVPEVKKKYISEAEAKVEQIYRFHQKGLLNDEGRYTAVVTIWRDTTEKITKELKESLGKYNPINMMSESGARGNINQIKQLAGMRGNMTDTSGRTIEIPIKSNLREGMNVLEFFISSHGARKALSDTALKTADSGYLTRRLVDVAQDVIIRESDCGTKEYTVMYDVFAGGTGKAQRLVRPLWERITGRYAAMDVLHPETGELLFSPTLSNPNVKNPKYPGLITEEDAERISKAGVKSVTIRSVLTCRARYGICAKCYGDNLANREPAAGGEAVGIMAAQSIGEPGTQLTMRTFHTGGIASGDDITQGLPRVEELFEARKPKGYAIVSETAGTVRIEETTKRRRDVVVTSADGTLTRTPISYGAPLLVKDGDVVSAGSLITEGPVNPHDIMKHQGVPGVQHYIIQEVLKVYKNNGVDINDKHVEIITRQMMRKVRVDDPGDTELLTGSIVDMYDFEEQNNRAETEGLLPATGKRVLLGITKASLATDSFLSAASFQETTRVLTDAAVKGKVDPLLGLKENVIIGKLIPAGTGMMRYRNITAVPVVEENRHLIITD